jgi:CRP-like cAMP-binding protein
MTSLEVLDREPHSDFQLLRGLQARERDVVLGAARTRRFPCKSIMTYQGEPAEHLFLLSKGRARYFYETSNGKRLILTWITPGQMFGLAALANRAAAYLLSKEAVRDSVALTWTSSSIRALARRFPQLYENSLAAAEEYVNWYAAAHAALTSQTAGERLAHILLQYAAGFGLKFSGGVELDVTNEELAHAANISPYMASRLLSQWQKTGALRKRCGKILVRFPGKLFLGVI